MQGLNVIWVFNPTADKVLMCKRHKEPYKGLYNLVGGKIEYGEDSLRIGIKTLPVTYFCGLSICGYPPYFIIYKYELNGIFIIFHRFPLAP